MQVVLPQFGVPDVGDVVERAAHDGLVLTLPHGCGLRYQSGLRLRLPGSLSKLWRLRDASGELGTKPERERKRVEKGKMLITIRICFKGQCVEFMASSLDDTD